MTTTLHLLAWFPRKRLIFIFHLLLVLVCSLWTNKPRLMSPLHLTVLPTKLFLYPVHNLRVCRCDNQGMEREFSGVHREKAAWKVTASCSAPLSYKQYYTISKFCKLWCGEMQFLPVLYQNLNKPEVCAFNNTLCPRLMSHKHLGICSSLQYSSCNFTGLQGKFKFKDILICRLKTYRTILFASGFTTI